jgi:hypothetical protein
MIIRTLACIIKLETIIIDDPSLGIKPQLASSITTVSDAPNCSVTYDRHYDDRNSFIIQATWWYKMTVLFSKIDPRQT